MTLKLGLIGAGIGRSRAPELHRLAGAIADVDVTYDLLQVDSSSSAELDAVLRSCRVEGYRGVNVTHPFKERVVPSVRIGSDRVRRLGAVNTLLFGEEGDVQAFNTDYTGFKRAYAHRFPGSDPGAVAIVGTGGVGRAIAFGLCDMGAREIRLYDENRGKSAALAAAVGGEAGVAVRVCDTLEEALADVAGIVNASPVGMYQYPGSPVPARLIHGQAWAFEAIYTPRKTQFLIDAGAAGLDILEGYELFFYQGVDAFELFTGVAVDEARLRDALAQAEARRAVC